MERGKPWGANHRRPRQPRTDPAEVRRREADDIANGSISPPSAIQFEEIEGEDFGRHKDAERRQQVGPVLRRHSEVKSQQEREDTGAANMASWTVHITQRGWWVRWRATRWMSNRDMAMRLRR
jgi:hypothetical protein